MVRLSQFAADHADEIAAIDLNPVIVHAQGDGVSVVDALIVKRDGRGSNQPRARPNKESEEVSWARSRISASRKPATSRWSRSDGRRIIFSTSR